MGQQQPHGHSPGPTSRSCRSTRLLHTVCSAQREQVARRGRSWFVEKTGAEDSREMRPLIAGAQARPGARFSSQSP